MSTGTNTTAKLRKTKPQGWPSPQGPVGRLHPLGPARQTRRRQRAVPLRPAKRSPQLDLTSRHPRTAARTRTRQRRSGLARRGAGEGAGQPQARPRGRGPARREAAGAGSPQLRGGGREGGRAAEGRLAQSEVREGLAEQSRALRIRAHRQDAGHRGHGGRHLRGPCADLACEGAHRPDGAPSHASRVGMGRGDGVAARQPV